MDTPAIGSRGARRVRAVIARGGAVLRFAWSGFAGLAALCLLAALWQAGHERFGEFILPAPLATAAAALEIVADPAHRATAMHTTLRALHGFAWAAATGTLLGLAAGASAATMRIARPLLTTLLGVPPIAWIVIAMIWFGSTDGTVVATVLVAATPMVFVGVAEGVGSRDRGLDDMARAFGAGPLRRLVSITARQVCTHLFPALAVALGTAIKVAVMAELLANVGGIGGALAGARANLDIARAMAWVLVAVGALIALEYGVLHPVRAEFERWRDAARPWGVRR